MHVTVGHDDDARSGWYARHDIAGRGEIAGVVVDDLIVEDSRRVSARLRQIRQIENKNAASIVLGNVSVNVRIHRIFYLDAGNIVLGDRIANDDVFGLADIDTRIGCTAYDNALDEHVS